MTRDADLELHARLMLMAARQLYSAVLCGQPNRHQEAILRRMSAPVAGDWVYELSTSFFLPPERPQHPAINKVGRLIGISIEPLPDWDDAEEPNPGEKCIYIRRLDGTVFRWTNADVLAFATGDQPNVLCPTVF